ncbi:Tn3 family transposase [Bacillus paramycoides]
MFGFIHLLGFNFTPRIRELSDSKSFTIDKANEYPKLEGSPASSIST